jgi:hypothetical protein
MVNFSVIQVKARIIAENKHLSENTLDADLTVYSVSKN